LVNELIGKLDFFLLYIFYYIFACTRYRKKDLNDGIFILRQFSMIVLSDSLSKG